MNQANLVSKMQAVLCSKNKIKRFVSKIEINCKPDSTRKKIVFMNYREYFIQQQQINKKSSGE